MPVTSGASVNTAPVTTTPVTSAAAATTPVTATSAPANGAATNTASTSTSATAATPGPTSSSAANLYGQQGLIGALQALVKDLTNSQIVTSTTGSNLSSNAISTLNTAFTQLISALGGNTAASSPSSTTAATASTPASTTTAASTAGTTTAASSGTAALQSFLTNLLSDLQNNGGSTSLTALGGTVNTTA
ncbi:MAG: hypothetical protein ABSF94_07490 [Steroidobacteraceae bacterium]